MRQEQATAILTFLDGHWSHGTPASEYPNSRCLGMAIADTGGQPVMPEIEQEIRCLFPGRLGTPRPLLPAFQCCNSGVIPAFNNHADTTMDDIRLVVSSAAGSATTV